MVTWQTLSTLYAGTSLCTSRLNHLPAEIRINILLPLGLTDKCILKLNWCFKKQRLLPWEVDS